MATADAKADALLTMLLNVVQELWIVKDRQMVLEKLLADAGIDAGRAVNDYQPDAAMAAELSAARKLLLERCLGSADDTTG